MEIKERTNEMGSSIESALKNNHSHKQSAAFPTQEKNPL